MPSGSSICGSMKPILISIIRKLVFLHSKNFSRSARFIPNFTQTSSISPNLKNMVYCTAVKYGNEMEWEFLYDRFLKATVSSEKETILSALGCSRETWILRRYLERAMSDKQGIRKQDVFRVFAAISTNIIGQPIAFDFIRDNWKRMKE